MKDYETTSKCGFATIRAKAVHKGKQDDNHMNLTEVVYSTDENGTLYKPIRLDMKYEKVNTAGK